MTDWLPDLPIVGLLDDLRAVLRDRWSAVLQAEPGAGKTTVVPLALLDEPWADGRIIVVGFIQDNTTIERHFFVMRFWP